MNNLIYFNPDQKNRPVYQNDDGIIEFFNDYDAKSAKPDEDLVDDFVFDDFDDDEWDFCSELLYRFLATARNLKPHMVKIGYILLMLAVLPFLVSFARQDSVNAAVYFPNPNGETMTAELAAVYPVGYNGSANDVANEEVSFMNGIIDVCDPEYEPMAIYMAKTMYLEVRGVWSETEQACVAWTILNRVDDPRFESNIVFVVTAPNQFAYSKDAPTVDDYGRDLVKLAQDVIYRWKQEKLGNTAVGRVLPREYVYFSGDGNHNNFCKSFYYGSNWDYSLVSPYAT